MDREMGLSDITPEPRVITEASAPYRIVHVNQAWTNATGYTREQMLGNTCRMLQGAETCLRTRQVLHDALRSCRPITVRLLNYRADDTPFVNDLTVLPIADPTTGATTHFIGIMRDRPLPGMTAPTATTAPTTQLSAPPAAGQAPSAADVDAPAAALAAPRTQSAAAASVRIPTQFQEALQRDVPFPQMITERQPPYKAVHVNKAWCLYCDYKSEELLGRPYGTSIFGSQTSPEVQSLLEQAISSGTQASCHAIYHSKSQQLWQCQHIVSPLMDVTSTSAPYVLHLLRPVVPAAEGGAKGEGTRAASTAAAADGDESSRGSSAGAEATSMSMSSLAGTSRDNSADGNSSNNDVDEMVDDEALADDDASADEGSSPCRESSEVNSAPSNASSNGGGGGGASAAGGVHAGGGGAVPHRDSGVAHEVPPRVQGDALAGAKRPMFQEGVGTESSDPPKQALTAVAVQAMMLANLESRAASENGVALPPAEMGAGGQNGGGNAWDARGGNAWGLKSHQLLQTQSTDLPAAPMAGIHPFCNYQGYSHHPGMMGGLALANLQPPTSIALERAVGIGLHNEEHGHAGRAGSSQAGHQDGGSNNSDDGSGSGSNGGSGSGSGSGNSAATTIACAQRSSGAGSSSGRVPPFLTKLYTIVDEAQPEDYAAWCADGKAFRITDPQKFADRCLPRFFKHNKLGSFQQQLLTYGFQRVPNSSCLDISAVWQHPLFQRGRPGQLELIQRATSRRSSGGAKEADDEGGAEEASQKGGGSTSAVDDELPAMKAHLGKLAGQLTDLHDELRAARAVEMQALDALVHRLHKRLRSEPPIQPPPPQLPPAASAPAAPADSTAESRLVPTALAP